MSFTNKTACLNPKRNQSPFDDLFIPDNSLHPGAVNNIFIKTSRQFAAMSFVVQIFS